MRVLVTGSSGHLGEALMRSLDEHELCGLDIKPSPFTTHVGTITDRSFVDKAMAGIDAVLHTATLHKPHIATHSRQDFIDTNITGTLNLLEAAADVGSKAFVFASTTSVFGNALRPPLEAPAAWITEEVQPVPKNIYGVTKAAAEDLCALFSRNHGLNCIVLRLSRFFPEDDDDSAVRDQYAADNAKANEFLYRRVDVEDAVSAHRLALDRAPALGFDRFIISATTPFLEEDAVDLRRDAVAVVRKRCRDYRAEYDRRGWKLLPSIDRIYINELARTKLGWQPQYNFATIIDRLMSNQSVTSPLASKIGVKGYHAREFSDGPYPVA